MLVAEQAPTTNRRGTGIESRKAHLCSYLSSVCEIFKYEKQEIECERKTLLLSCICLPKLLTGAPERFTHTEELLGRGARDHEILFDIRRNSPA